MKKKFIKPMAMVLSTAMLATMMPSYGLENVLAKNNDIVIGLDKPKDNVQKKNYVEGEALIVTSSSAGDLSKGADEDYYMEEEYQFGDDELSSASAVENNQVLSAGMSVCLVKSDKLSTEELVKALKQRSDISYVSPNYICKAYNATSDEYSEYQWALENDGYDINPESIWNTGVTGTDAVKDEEPVIAVIDTGVDYTHPDLAANMWVNPCPDKIPGTHGYDFVNNDEEPLDEYGHGTHCAGIIAAEAGNEGISGVNQHAKIMSLRVLDDQGAGTLVDVVAAYSYVYRAQKAGVNIIAINDSWGFSGLELSEIESILTECINLAGENGAISFCAAGNESSDIDSVDTMPACVDSKYKVTVSALNEKNELAEFSNYGSKTSDIAAPGTDILSTVSEECFNPGIYSDEKKSQVCSNFKNFSADTDLDGIVAKSGKVTINYDENFLKKVENNGSLEWNLDVKSGKTYELRIPYRVNASNTELFGSFMMRTSAKATTKNSMYAMFGYENLLGQINIADVEKAEKVSDTLVQTVAMGDENYWNHVYFEMTSAGETDNQDREIVVQFIAVEDGTLDLKIDDFGTSKENASSTEFGKYDFYNGTSMATPYTTGAGALIYAKCYDELKGLDSSQRAIELKNRVLSCSKKNEKLKGKVATEGSLDLSYLYTPSPVVTSITGSNDGKIDITGANFVTKGNKSKVYVNGSQVDAEVENEHIVITDTEHLNQAIEIKIVNDFSEAVEEYYVKSYSKDVEKCEIDEDMNTLIASPEFVFSDGENMYAFDSLRGTISRYEEEMCSPGEDIEGAYMKNYWTPYTSVSTDLVFEDINKVLMYNTVMEFNSGIRYYDDKFVALVTLNHENGQGKAIYSEEYIVSFDKTTRTWSYYELPEKINVLKDSAFGMYNGNIVIAGGVNGSNEYSKQVAKISFDDLCEGKDTWVITDSLPSQRAGGSMYQTGTKLVLAGGNNGSKSELVKNVIYDGKEWKESAADLKVAALKNDSEEPLVMESPVGICKDGLIYVTEKKYSGYGNVFVYNAEEDCYETTGYYFNKADNYDNVFACEVNDRVFIYGTHDWVENFEIEYFKKSDSGIMNNPIDEDLEEYIEENGIDSNDVYKINIESGMHKITFTQNIKYTGLLLGAKNVYPGGKANLEMGSYDATKYYPISMTVAGKKYTPDENGVVSCSVNVNSDVKAKLVWGKYVSSISFKNGNKLYLTPGSKKNVKAYASKDATNRKLSYSVSNKKYAKVDSKGNVTALKAGLGKTVKITVKPKDGSAVKAVCKVYIVKSVKNKK